MNLEEFITKTLVDIKKGLRSANEALVEEGKELGVNASATFQIGSDKCEVISFDIAVTSSEEKGREGNGQIKVMSLGVGGNVNKTEIQQSVSRIKFNVRSSMITG